jgi:WD40 repeat protein
MVSGFPPIQGRLMAKGRFLCGWLILTLLPCTTALACQPDAPEVTALCFLPNSKTLLAACLDESVHVYDVASRKETASFVAHKNGVWCMTLSPGGDVIITGGGDKLVRLWDARTYKLLKSFDGCAQSVLAVALSPDGKLLAAGAADGVICTWDAATGKRIRYWRAHEQKVLSLSFSPDAQLLASGGTCIVPSANLVRGVIHADHVRLWNPQTGKEIRPLAASGSTVAYAPDGRTIAAAGYHVVAQPRENAALRPLMRAETEAAIALPVRETRAIEIKDAGTGLALSGDGRVLALGYGSRRHVGSDRFIQDTGGANITIWETATGKRIREIEQGDASVLALAPNCKVLAAAVPFVGVRFWDLFPPAQGTPDGENTAPPTTAKLWDDLLGAEPGPAYQAIAALGCRGEAVVDFLRSRLTPVPAPRQDLPELIAKLDHEKFATRESAFREVKLLGTAVEGNLRKALQNERTSAECRQRILKLLEKMEVRPAGPEELRQLRALQVLAMLGNESARSLVARIAAGAPGAWFTQQAQITLARWEPR